jgi:hypothetical protein
VNGPSKKWIGLVIVSLRIASNHEINDMILHMDHHQTSSDVCHFICCVNYYHDMWPGIAHVLKPLMDFLGMKKNQPLNLTDNIQTVCNNRDC